MKSWPKVIEFCDSVIEFYQFCPHAICTKFVNLWKLGHDLESPHFRTFPAKRRKFKIWERDGHGKSRNGQGKVMEKYFVKSVGTLRMFVCESLI